MPLPLMIGAYMIVAGIFVLAIVVRLRNTG
jgi:hypothetical protein